MPWLAGARVSTMPLHTKRRSSGLSATLPGSREAPTWSEQAVKLRYDRNRIHRLEASARRSKTTRLIRADPGRQSVERAGRGRTSVPIDPDNPALFDRECQPSLFQRQGGVAEQLAAPAVQRADVGVVVGRDLFQIVDGSDHLAGDGVALRRHPQQNFQQFDDRRTI